MTTIERWREESNTKVRQEGRQEGVHIGEDKKAHDVAMKLLKRGDSVADVVEISGLTKAEVIKIKASITH